MVTARPVSNAHFQCCMCYLLSVIDKCPDAIDEWP
jgi:hypothetical protein